MLVGVCDFPGDYEFPPCGYGGIERWLWAVAVGARRTGADVHLLGPQWRSELIDDWCIRPIRLEHFRPDGPLTRDLQDSGYDLLVVGHEYPSLPSWRAVWDTLDCDVATFQHWPYFKHQANTFDGARSRLYCYSAEMRERFREHRPAAELAVHLDLGETEEPGSDGDTLLWMGRIDAQKAPHLATRAAGLLGRHIVVAGPVFDSAYVDEHRDLLLADHVTMVGEVGGHEKARLLSEAGTLVYTCARGYVEAGAASFGEALRAGTPVAALTWRAGTCADAALCEHTGHIARVNSEAGDDSAVAALAGAVEQTTQLRARQVQEVGLSRFDPARHFEALATRPC